VFSDDIAIDIEPHDTRVVAIHPLLARPQLIGNSRHITGAYSIDQEWDPSKNRLSGTSETVPGEPYTVWFYLPKGFAVEHLSVVAKGNEAIAEQHLLTGNALMLSFKGQQQPVRWEVSFSVSPKK
jgi:hypothetical protein